MPVDGISKGDERVCNKKLAAQVTVLNAALTGC
jgi:hypothetical protein